MTPPIIACHRCPLRQPYCAGRCPCTVDGVDITRHAAAGYCPHPNGPRYGDGAEPAAWEKVKADQATADEQRERMREAAEKYEQRKAELGRAAWAKLHTEGVGQGAAWLTEWERLIPCGECKAKYAALKAARPPTFPLTFEWTWELHDAVSAGLPGKEQMELDAARKRWATAGVRRS